MRLGWEMVRVLSGCDHLLATRFLILMQLSQSSPSDVLNDAHDSDSDSDAASEWNKDINEDDESNGRPIVVVVNNIIQGFWLKLVELHHIRVILFDLIVRATLVIFSLGEGLDRE